MAVSVTHHFQMVRSRHIARFEIQVEHLLNEGWYMIGGASFIQDNREPGDYDTDGTDGTWLASFAKTVSTPIEEKKG
jgi:hypothetical protein